MSRRKWARCAVCRKATYVCAKRRCLSGAAPAAPAPKPGPDYLFTGHGSLWLCEPRTDAAREHLQEHTDGQWLGNRLAVEHRYVGSLVQALADAGFRVRVE